MPGVGGSFERPLGGRASLEKWDTGAGLEGLQSSFTSCLFCGMAADATWPAVSHFCHDSP